MTSYDWNRNLIAEMVPQRYMDDYMIIKPINIPNSQHFSASLNYSTTFFKIWRPNWDISVNKDYIKLGNLSFNAPVLYTNFRNNIKLGSWQLGVNIRSISKGNENTAYHDKITWATILSVDKNFLHDKLQISIAGYDIFNTMTYKDTYVNAGLRSVWSDYMYRRMAILEIHYRFNIEQKNRYKGNRSTDELNRF